MTARNSAIVTSSQIEATIRSLGARAGLRESDLPTFGTSAHNGRAHIEVVGQVYYYVTCERGVELERTLFTDQEELAYQALKDATSQMASDLEVATRSDENHDTRRDMFRIHQEMMSRIEEGWGERLEREYAAVLQRHPFDDERVVRMKRFKELLDSGLDEDGAWELARLEFPEPLLSKG